MQYGWQTRVQGSDSRSCRMDSVLYTYTNAFFYHFGAVQDQSSMDGLFRAQKKMECTTHLLHNNVCFNFSSQYTKSQLQTAYNSIYRRYKTITLDIYQLVKIQYGQQTMRFRAFVHCKTYLDQSTAMASEAPPLSSMLIFSSAIALSSSAILFCSSSIEICNSSTCSRYKHMNRYSRINLLCRRLN